ncbi:MAG: glucose-1-phosphate thymidylyltransferase RfbA [Chloroflexota bacterium]
MSFKGIVLAGGGGSRLYPLTNIFSKQLQVIYDKPMVYYPLSTLMLAGIRDVLLISTPQDTPNFEKLLGDGSRLGINISYCVQPRPAGIAQAYVLAEEFLAGQSSCMILGDNLFYGKLDFLRNAISKNEGGTVFGYRVQNPSEYGVVEFGESMQVLSIEEKPKQPKSNHAIPGLYIFDGDAPKLAKELKPGPRGELEIVDLQKEYLVRGKLKVELMGRGIAWLDTGTPESLLEAGMFIHAIEKRQGRKIACLEEVALRMGYIDEDGYSRIVGELPSCSYRRYCEDVLNDIS